jgi:hypothetical protein
MSEHFAFYSSAYESLPEDHMRALAGDAEFAVKDSAEGGRSYVYTWPNMSITCNEMPAPQLPNHLQGFAGWVQRIYQGNPDARGLAILQRLRDTRLIVGMVVEPLRDDAGVAEQLLSTLSNGLDALLFFDSAIYDKNAILLLGPDGSFDEQAVIGNQPNDRIKADVQLPPDPTFQPSEEQKARLERVNAILQARKVPTLSYPLYINDAANTKLHDAQDVARRVLVLSAVTLRADGGSRAKAVEVIEQRELWLYVSPEERAFLDTEDADSEQAQKLLWRLEALWVLVWALGEIKELDWPSQMCDVQTLVTLLMLFEDNDDFIAKAKLRDASEILDATHLTMLTHWAIRDAWVHRRSIPMDLDWSASAEMVSVQQCPTVGVVAERHHALNWLTCFQDAEWDDVDTPT